MTDQELRHPAITVGRLIEILRQFPDNMKVAVDGYEAGIDPLKAECIQPAKVRDFDPDQWKSYYGAWTEVDGSRDGKPVLVIARQSNGDITRWPRR